MGKKKDKSRTSKGLKPAKTQSWKSDSRLLSGIWSCYKYWSLFFGIIGPILMIHSVLPAISVHPSSSLEPSDPFSAPFIIVNNGSFSIYDVKISFPVNYLKTAKQSGEADVTLTDSDLIVDGANEIKSHASLTTFLAFNRIFGEMGKLEKSDIELTIKYRPKFIPHVFKKSFNFYSHQASDGTVTWLPY